MSGRDRQQGVALTTERRRRVRAMHPRALTALLLCWLLTAGAAPGSRSAGAAINAERASSSGIGSGEMVLPEPAPSPASSPQDSGYSPNMAGQSAVADSSTAPSAPLQPVVVSALASDGIPAVAARAYQHAADIANQRSTGCALPWTLLAAIGRVESDHGRYAGSVLLANGLSTPRIIGIPLNGVGTGLILDTDHGVLDGDPVFDHALGPMQFIPSTWVSYATDGNGNGVADPFNIYDAAAAAGKYLCNAGGDLGTRAGQIRAVLSYNHSDSYVASVLALEATYAGTPITAEPASVTPVVSTPLPPVNPGVPPAIYPKVPPLASMSPMSTSPGTPGPFPSTPGFTPTPTDTTPTPTDTTPTPTPTDTTLPPPPAPTPTCTPLAQPPTDAPSGTLTDAQKTTLAAVAEEQQLAHDLYLAFADKYGASLFTCMSKDETWQLTDTDNVLKLYAVADPIAGQPGGTFSSASTQQRYDTLLAQGAKSVDTAVAAARSVESTEVTHVKSAAADLTAPDVLQLYTNLLDASQSHLLALGG